MSRRLNANFFTGLVFFVCVFLFQCSVPSFADEFKASIVQSKVIATVQKALPASVAVYDRGAIFSAVIVTKEGHVLSAGHAVEPGRRYRIVLSSGQRVRAVGLGMNRRIDCAMLKIVDDGVWPFVEMGHSSNLKTNQPVVGISHPGYLNLNRGPSVRFGRIIKPMTSNEAMVLSTVKIEPGDSGGALLDLDGRLIGIHSNIRRSVDENYAVPIDTYRALWDDLIEPGEFEVEGWPNLPKLGFRGRPDEYETGLEVIKVYPGGIAEKSGLKTGDVIRLFDGKTVNSAIRIRYRLIDLRSRGRDRFALTVQRGKKQTSLTFNLELDQPDPVVFPELEGIPDELSSWESRLDDTSCVIRSKRNNESLEIRAVRLVRNGVGNIVSKSSEVGDDPIVELSTGKQLAAKVIKRDRENDLVLLHVNNLPGRVGIDLNKVFGDLALERGKFLISTDPRGPGEISVWSSGYFRSPRSKMSGGYLGVRVNQRPGEVYFLSVERGAARKAGIRRNDVLLKLDNVPINRSEDVFDFLRQQDPSKKIKALIRRGEDQLTKEIVLGKRPENSRHVADNLREGKSIRRDGFDLVFCHDANVGAEECGGPVFDLNGSFVGINISRFSRTRCYVLPRSLIKQFVDSVSQ